MAFDEDVTVIYYIYCMYALCSLYSHVLLKVAIIAARVRDKKTKDSRDKDGQRV